jgi:hypothetical protein
MNKRIFWVLLSVLGLSGLTSTSWALGEIGAVEGGVYHSAVQVRESLQFGDINTIIERGVIKIPEDYGKLINIIPANGMSVFWFSNDEGVIRNVVIPMDQLWILQRSGRVVKDK